MRYLFSLFLVAFIGLADSSADAKPPMGKRWYGSVSGGVVGFTHNMRVADGQGFCDACRNVKVSSKVGYNVSGSLGGWVNDFQRTEISAGYRSYNTDFTVAVVEDRTASPIKRKVSIFSGAARVIPILVGNYFYPIAAFPSLPQAHQPYFGFGVGVGLWSFDIKNYSGATIDNSYKNIAFMATGTIGYDFYFSSLKDRGIRLPATVQNMAIGVSYQYSWGSPKPYINTPVNQSVNQSSHIISGTWRFEF